MKLSLWSQSISGDALHAVRSNRTVYARFILMHNGNERLGIGREMRAAHAARDGIGFELTELVSRIANQ